MTGGGERRLKATELKFLGVKVRSGESGAARRDEEEMRRRLVEHATKTGTVLSCCGNNCFERQKLTRPMGGRVLAAAKTDTADGETRWPRVNKRANCEICGCAKVQLLVPSRIGPRRLNRTILEGEASG
jgi:hypothetical protein